MPNTPKNMENDGWQLESIVPKFDISLKTYCVLLSKVGFDEIKPVLSALKHKDVSLTQNVKKCFY